MAKEAAHQDALSPEIQEVMRSLITAIRAVKLYPPNNPIYSQSVAKAYEFLSRFLETAPEYRVGVRKTFFTYGTTPFGKDAELNKAIAQDLFAKEVRELAFSEGLVEEELMVLLKALALSLEEIAMKSGISSVLWEFGATHIKVTESGLDEVITAKTEQGWNQPAEASAEAGGKAREKKASLFAGRTLVLGTLMADPEGFGASMLELARQTRGENESVEDRLYSLYQEAGQKIRKEHPEESDTLFESLAQSVLSLERNVQEGFVAGKLYADLDAELASEQTVDFEDHIPNEPQEIQTGRFSNAWTVQQVSTLLKKTTAKKSAPPAAAPDPQAFEVAPVSAELAETIAPELAGYTQEELDALKAMSGVGMESDIIQTAVRTLIFLIPLVKNPHRPVSEDQEVKLFSGVIRQLEELLGYLQKKKNYELAAIIIRAFHSAVAPAFKARMTEALKKTASKSAVADMIVEMRTRKPDSAEYAAAYLYLKTLDRAGTSLLLDLLAEERDRDTRLFLLDILKDMGKNQLALVGEQLSDRRWFVVRNAVRILGDAKTEQALAFLHKVADHKDARIREEVISSLINIGGRKAAGILARYLKDKDPGLQVLALRGLGEFQGLGDTEASYVMNFAELRPVKQRELERILDAISVLGRIGGGESAEFLARYTRVRWWKPRKLQEELRAAARSAIEAINRRRADAGKTKR